MAATNAAADTLPESVNEALKRAHIPLSGVGVVVQEVHQPEPLISWNADEAMNPASTMKLLTTFAAMDTLGPAYRWKTEVYLDGKLENGVLQGDLVFKGYGDPKLTVEQFWMWLRELRQRGLRDIHGDIVLDDSYFEGANPDSAEFDNDPARAYNVGTNALLLNFNVMHLHLIPDGKSTIALLEPDLAGYTLINHLATSKKSFCGGKDAFKVSLDGHDIVLEGDFPEVCGEVDKYFSILPHDEYFLAVFSALWHELGGTLQGRLRIGRTPVGQVPYSRYVSPPLSEVIRDINKFSNNVMARQLFLTLGVESTARSKTNFLEGGSDSLPNESPTHPENLSNQQTIDITDDLVGGDAQHIALQDSFEMPEPQGSGQSDKVSSITPVSIVRSTTAIQQWLNSQLLAFPELVLENGAGLSRKERISPRHLAELLRHAVSSPFFAELEASLPILGMDGTVKKRFTESEIAGYAHLKTGSLEGVKSLAGYVQAQSGKQWVVVFIVNNPKAAQAQPAQDALIEWLQKMH